MGLFKSAKERELDTIILRIEMNMSNNYKDNAISWTEKFKLDVWYVDHCTLLTDLKIIVITIKNVLMRKDINSATAATMEVFTGNN